MNFGHLHALEHRRHTESMRIAAAKTGAERELRAVWLAQIEREIVAERCHLGIAPESLVGPELDDDELLKALAP